MSKLRSSLIGGVSALALLAAVGITNPASAGEDWSGFYVGANVGYGEAEMEGCVLDCPTFDPFETILLERLDPGGLAGGAHAGFNFQVSEFFPGGQDLIIGIEGDVMFLDWQDRVAGPPDGSGSPTNDFATADIDLLASLRGRLGILTDAGSLIYLTGGIAFVQGEARGSLTPGRSVVANLDDTGAVVGGGIEFPLGGLAIGRIEGLYYLFDGTRTFSGTASEGGGSDTFAGVGNIFVVRAGVSIPLN